MDFFVLQVSDAVKDKIKKKMQAQIRKQCKSFSTENTVERWNPDTQNSENAEIRMQTRPVFRQF